MNYLFHKAYDEYLLGISPDYDIIISDKFFGEKLKDVDSRTLDYVRSYNNRKIFMPKRFLPNKDLLAEHFMKFKQHIW